MQKTAFHQDHHHAVIGDHDQDFWLHSYRDGFDLTRPEIGTDKMDGLHITIETLTTPIKIAAHRTALVIIDMQNFFLSEAFGRDPKGAGHAAMHCMLNDAIPAARKAGIRVIWLNWGLTDEDISSMAPTLRRTFGFKVIEGGKLEDEAKTVEQSSDGTPAVKSEGALAENGKPKAVYRGMGVPCGNLRLPSGETVDAGRLLMRDSWNADLYGPLKDAWEAGQKAELPDVWMHKDRMSGFWGAKTMCEEFLEKEGIRTLLFGGVNTDQCVSGSLTDAFNKGYDCVMLKDACGTTSPAFAQDCIEYNAGRSWGFVSECAKFARAVDMAVPT